jgi:hypothetical protein
MTRKVAAIAVLSLLALSTGAQACGHLDLGLTKTRHCLFGWIGMPGKARLLASGTPQVAALAAGPQSRTCFPVNHLHVAARTADRTSKILRRSVLPQIVQRSLPFSSS